MEEYNKLEVLIKKYLNECENKDIKIIAHDKNHELVKIILDKYNAKSLNKENIGNSCIVVLIKPQYNDELVKLINDNINKNVIFLAVVSLDFKFDDIVKNVAANSIDVDYWRKNGKRYKNYIITIKKD